ncbi:hypothetical protein [Flammeovirga sp. SJP92]|uniref:hypothetical protein n=1 Tax=Flammeovirga sp. SJP92 TaxID=1775430 RepID=UPI0012FA41BA|nr:hypothetical protein [Flammeovirga sp. SJP92]
MLDEIESSFWEIIEELDNEILKEQKIIDQRSAKKQLLDFQRINQLKRQRQHILKVRDMFHTVNNN